MLKKMLLGVGGFFQKLVDKTTNGIDTDKEESEKIQKEWEELKKKGQEGENNGNTGGK